MVLPTAFDARQNCFAAFITGATTFLIADIAEERMFFTALNILPDVLAIFFLRNEPNAPSLVLMSSTFFYVPANVMPASLVLLDVCLSFLYYFALSTIPGSPPFAGEILARNWGSSG